MYFIGFDVGGTKIEAALMNLIEPENSTGIKVQLGNGKFRVLRVLDRQRVPTERQLGYESICKKMATLAVELCKKSNLPLTQLTGIGIALPGSVDPSTNVMLSGNTLALVGKHLSEDLCHFMQIKLPVRIENDANCFALAEALAGAGVELANKQGRDIYEQTGVGIILGTGCGGGVVIRGKTFVGRRGGAGEVGHSILQSGGFPCYCGRNGCAEQYLSGPALEAAFQARTYSQISGQVSSKGIFELYQNKDPMAVAVIRQYKRHLSDFLSNLTNLFDPDYFVLGGGMSLQSTIYEGLSEEIARKSFLQTEVPVLKHALGDSAGVVGAGLLCVEQ